MKGFTTSVAASVVFGASLAKAITPVTIKGNAFFAGDQRFYIRGIDYQPGGASGADTDSGVADPIADVAGCKRDIENFKTLQINTVRVYTVDNSANHDECMQMLSDAGIYLALDVNTPSYAINRDDPKPSYNDVYLQSVFATIDAFSKYDNTLLFFSGNEVINDPTNSNCAPYIKAVIRDMKSYISQQNLRQIPVGYSAADVAENREQTAFYLNCGSVDARSDFFAFNDYSWCDPSTFDESGWDKKVKTYQDYSIPLFLSEYGCIKTTRKFQEVATLYSSQMTPVYSGGLVYEYSEEGQGFGLTTISSAGKVTPEPDFNALATAFKGTPAPQTDGGYKTSGSPSKCPPAGTNWDVHSDLLPAIPEPAVKFLNDGAGKGPGLNGPGSMNAGTPSTGLAKPGSGTSDGSDTSDTPGAAANVNIPEMSFIAPALVSMAVLASSFFGASLL